VEECHRKKEQKAKTAWGLNRHLGDTKMSEKGKRERSFLGKGAPIYKTRAQKKREKEAEKRALGPELQQGEGGVSKGEKGLEVL